MTTSCDSTTLELFRHAVGMKLEKVAACRYGTYLAYSKIVATFANDFSIRIDLADQTIAPLFEVFVARARPVEQPIDSTDWDRFELRDFVVASVFLLRREEWIEKPAKIAHQTAGQHGVEQHFGVIGAGDDGRQAVIVDSGVCFISTRGAELSLDADTFPLVLQLRYEVAPSPLPQGSRVAVNEYRTPQ